MIDLSGKTALVTGGSRGIGRAIAIRLATQGADVAFTYKGNADAAAETTAFIEALERRALAIQGDASQADTADAVVKTVLEAFGKVDILVNNAGLTRDDLIRFHRTWFRPNHATLVVVGATTMAEIRPRLERLFARWEPGEVPTKNIGTVEQQPRSTVYLLDRPDAIQSLILVGNVAPPKANPDEPAIETMNQILGGTPTARLNLNLREDKHWSYGSFSFFRDARGQRPFMAYAPVQTDKTVEALAELRKELSGMVEGRPPTPEELARAQSSLTLTLPGNWETMDAVAGSIGEIVTFGLDDRYFDGYADRVRAQTLATVSAAARETIHPDRLVWVVVGDRAKIEQGVRNLGLGEIRLIDADGKPLGPT